MTPSITNTDDIGPLFFAKIAQPITVPNNISAYIIQYRPQRPTGAGTKSPRYITLSTGIINFKKRSR